MLKRSEEEDHDCSGWIPFLVPGGFVCDVCDWEVRREREIMCNDIVERITCNKYVERITLKELYVINRLRELYVMNRLRESFMTMR
jgi:hypothetical protein